ncbi:hypothetical protein RB653_002007 [Dictyostelium firmibasis]|uniref:Uncharacterized protein n=1 Tax=Dictyostelium firmibasis TaxID=79012 RepID=A0AAN7YYF8_9MYCE
MTKKIDKNAFIQRYLDKTNCSHWKLDDENNDSKENIIGFPSLEFLYEIQKSISFKLANKYKYISTYNNNEKDKNNNKEEEEEEEEEEYDDTEEDTEGDDDDDDDTDEESEKRKRKKVIKKKTHLITRSTCSGLLKMNSKNSINRFPLSQPCLKPEIYNERCGPEILMSLGVLYQQVLISQIKSLNSFQK